MRLQSGLMPALVCLSLVVPTSSRAQHDGPPATFAEGLLAGQIAADSAKGYGPAIAFGLAGGAGVALINTQILDDTGRTKDEYYRDGVITGVGSLILGVALAGVWAKPDDELVEGMEGDYRAGFVQGYRTRATERTRVANTIQSLLFMGTYLAFIAATVDDPSTGGLVCRVETWGTQCYNASVTTIGVRIPIG